MFEYFRPSDGSRAVSPQRVELVLEQTGPITREINVKCIEVWYNVILYKYKAPGEDNITTAVLQDGGEPIIKALTQLFNRCLSDGRVPSSWKNASVVLIYKRGNTADIKNYRPISLLPVICKVSSQSSSSGCYRH